MNLHNVYKVTESTINLIYQFLFNKKIIREVPHYSSPAYYVLTLEKLTEKYR